MAKRETDSVIIKRKLDAALPNFKFSVTRSSYAGGHSVSIYIMSGDIKPFVDESKNYSSGSVNEYYIDESDEYTPEMKKVIKQIIKISDEEGNYNGRHNSQFRDIHIGKYDKPYEYKPKATRTTTSATTTTRGGFDYGEMIEVCISGWVIYKKTLPNGSLVYNVVKGKKVVPNKTDWDAIRGEIYTQTGFKWTPRSQTFQRWGSIPNEAFTTKMVCDILAKYYPPMDEPQEPAQEPMPQSTSQIQEWKDFVKATIEKQGEVWDELGITSANGIYSNQDTQKAYINKMLTYLNFLNLNFTEDEKGKIMEYLTDLNAHTLNNFLALAGFFGNAERESFEAIYKMYVDANTYIMCLNPANFPKKADSKDDIQKQINSLELLAKYGDADAEKQINSLQVILKYAK